MRNYQLENDEVLLYGSIVEFDGEENIKFSLTNKKLIFEKESGLIQKKFRVIQKIRIDKIKMFEDDPQITLKRSTISVQSSNGDFEFTFGNKLEAKKVYNQMIHIKTGESIANRTAKKVGHFINDHKEAIALASTVATAAIGYAIKNKDKLSEMINPEEKD